MYDVTLTVFPTTLAKISLHNSMIGQAVPSTKRNVKTYGMIQLLLQKQNRIAINCGLENEKQTQRNPWQWLCWYERVAYDCYVE